MIRLTALTTDENRISHPFRSLVVTIIATLFAVGALCISIAVTERRINTFETYVLPMKQLKSDLRYYDSVLTNSALLFLVSGQKRWEIEYQLTATLLEEKIKAVEALSRDTSDSEKRVIATLVSANEHLLRKEAMAFELMNDGGRDEALKVFESTEYAAHKQRYERAVADLNAVINGNIQEIHRQERFVALTALLFAGLMVLVVLPAVWTMRVRLLSKWRYLTDKNTAAILRGKQEVNEMNAALEKSLEMTQRRRDEMRLLSEMASILHSCITPAETFEVVKSYCAQLFPGSHGGLFRLKASRDVLEEVGTWGKPELGKQVFEPVQCWALRRGTFHLGGINGGAVCSHITETAGSDTMAYLCVPLVAQNETVGLLHIQLAESNNSANTSDLEVTRLLVTAIAENVALALANIELRDRLREQSLRDSLTGLYNRRYLEESTAREILRSVRASLPFSVIAFDIDHFKRYNDTYGHDAGDKVLQAVARVLGKVFRESDVVCRLGGEEFIVLLSETALPVAQERAEKAREAIAALRLDQAGTPLGTITISGGVASFPSHGESIEDLLKSADLALYAAKRKGRDRIEVAGTENLNLT